MRRLIRQAGVSRLCLALLPLLLVAPVIAQQLEADLLVSQLDDDDPQRHEPYVACDSSGECLALTLLVHQHPWRCRDVELTAHVHGASNTDALTQVCLFGGCQPIVGLPAVITCRSTAQWLLWPDGSEQEQEYAVWPALLESLRSHLFSTTMALPVRLEARCAQVIAHSENATCVTQVSPQDARRALQESSAAYPAGVPVLLSVAPGSVATMLVGANATVTAVEAGYSGCPNVSLDARPAGAQPLSNCSAVIFTNQVRVWAHTKRRLFHHFTTTQTQFAIDITLAEPRESLPASALYVDNGASVIAVTKPGSLQLARRFTAIVQLPSSAAMTGVRIVLRRAALTWPSGDTNAQSNQLVVGVDTTAPAPTVTSGVPVADSNGNVQVTMLLDFGQRVFEVR